MAERAYLDWNATAPLGPQARQAMLEALDLVGNPSSIHAEGREARHAIEAARADVARLVGAAPENVVFTSGGTEANMLALSPSLDAGNGRPRDHLLVSAIEHPSVRSGGRFGNRVEEIPVTAEGEVDLAALQRRLDELLSAGISRTLVSIMLANNETGIVQPVAAAARIVHAAGGLLHVDAVQAAGRMPCDIGKHDADLMTLSAHKIGGPKGVGALVKRDKAVNMAEPLVKGGGQERGARAGTENVAAIAGFGAAAAVAYRALEADQATMTALRERLEAGLKAISPSAVIFGERSKRLPNTTLFAVPGIKAETAIIALDLAGVAASSGAACSSGKVQASHVLAAMGVDPRIARGAIRISCGPTTTELSIDRMLDAWIKVSRALNKGLDGIAA